MIHCPVTKKNLTKYQALTYKNNNIDYGDGDGDGGGNGVGVGDGDGDHEDNGESEFPRAKGFSL